MPHIHIGLTIFTVAKNTKSLNLYTRNPAAKTLFCVAKCIDQQAQLSAVANTSII